MLQGEALINKIKSLKPSEIIMYMVKGLQNPIEGNVIKLDMSDFGSNIDPRDGVYKKHVCFGCAATRAMQEISGESYKDNEEGHFQRLACLLSENTVQENWLAAFENAIDYLRCSNVQACNREFQQLGLLTIIIPPDGLYLAYLGDDDWQENITPYIKLAEYNKSIGN